MTEAGHNAFWDFSLSIWRREAVETACLALQERHGLDVNLLLFCGFAGCHGRALDIADIAALTEMARPWRENAVLPLRRLRSWLKDQTVAPRDTAERLRTRVKADELQAEAVQQALFLQVIPMALGGIASPAVTAANMQAYFEVQGIARDAHDTAHLAALLRACHPEVAHPEAVRLLKV